MNEQNNLPCPHCGGDPHDFQRDCQICIQRTKPSGIDVQACVPTPSASEQQEAISVDEAVKILLSGGTLVFRFSHTVNGEGV